MTFVYDLTLEQWLAAAITALPGAGIAHLLATDDDPDRTITSSSQG